MTESEPPTTTVNEPNVARTMDALTMVLGEFRDLHATVATQRPAVRRSDTGEPVAMTAGDQIAVAGRLDGGAVASMHFRGGLSRGTNFLWEINGTDGDLLLTSDRAHPQFGEIALLGGRGADCGTSPTEPSSPPDSTTPSAATGSWSGSASDPGSHPDWPPG
jgi:predicted dehydrogenase